MGSVHGGLNYEELRKSGIDPDAVVDFSVSINPDPLPRSVIRAFQNSRITRYPDSHCSLLKEEIARYNRTIPESILVLNGTSQGIFLIVNALLPTQGKVAIVEPVYGEYLDACTLKTNAFFSISMKARESFAVPATDICELVEREKPALLWLCSPNNPTGQYLDEMDFEKIRKSCVAFRTIFILDEAYICFVSDCLRYNPLRESVIVLRSMTKDFSIPGLRLGYLMASQDLIGKIAPWQPEWSISAPAQDAGIAGFQGIAYFKKSWQKTAKRRNDLRRELQGLGLKVHESSSNFFLVEFEDMEALKARLWEDLILIRDCHSFGLNNTFRIGVQTEKENAKLVNAIRDFLGSCG